MKETDEVRVRSIAEIFGGHVTPSRLTDEQKRRLDSDEYYWDVIEEMGKSSGPNKALIVAPPLYPNGK